MTRRTKPSTKRKIGAVGSAPSARIGVVVVLAAAIFVGTLNLTPLHENDFWIQLKVGDLIRSTGHIPATVLFACTEARDFPFVAHEWLPSVLSSAAYARIGYSGMIVVKCAVALLLFALCTALASRRGCSLPAASAISGVVLLAINFRTLMRPELVALVLFALSLLLIDPASQSADLHLKRPKRGRRE